jgi:septum formation protein
MIYIGVLGLALGNCITFSQTLLFTHSLFKKSISSMKIYLASKSPRRSELLTLMGVDFELLLLDIPEVIATEESPEAYSMRITKEKLEASWEKAVHDKLPLLPVLCADTEVVLDDKVLGKPENYDDAFTMLKSFSGRSHSVLTSVGLRYFDKQKIILNTTKVTFATMSDQDIHHYLALGDYIGKSGSYGIQSYMGQFITKIDGCFYSVMGLPLNSVRVLLDEVGLLF